MTGSANINSVHHAAPMVYNIRFQGSCALMQTSNWALTRILINNKVLISNRLLPNNDQRHVVAPDLGKNIDESDTRGGSMHASGSTTSVAAVCSKSDLVLLPAGTHFIGVGGRTTGGPFHVWGGELLVEATEYDPRVHIGLSYPTIY
ncbi:unnamed protein product [Adineta ricciae]|uniref:Uncharacterized protein n=1 Tax=Adineta ricciae TaxID=249248 RepID=A0A815MHU1_ADIRI|nr:unnamed protein product [Adineta ricciae]